MKKLTSILLCVMLVLTLMPAAFAADETVSEALSYDEMFYTVRISDRTNEKSGVPTADDVYADAMDEKEGKIHLEQDENSLPVLDEPTGLKWGINEYGEPFPGLISFTPASLTQGAYKVVVYREIDGGADEKIAGITFRHAGFNYHYPYFVKYFEESGNYYFTVQTVGDGTEYESSNTVKSDIWQFIAPAERIPEAYGLFWSFEDGRFMMNYDYDESEPVIGTATEILFAHDLNDAPVSIGDTASTSTRKRSVKVTDSLLPQSYIEKCGEGYYFFKAKLISGDLKTALCSEWSEISEPIYISDVSVELNNLTKDLDEDSALEEAEDTIEQVRALDTDELAVNMAADIHNTQAASVINTLERLAGRLPGITVTDDVSDTIDESGVSVTGAGLNADKGQSVKLKIDRAEKEHVLPAMYKNTVSFSMDIVDSETNESILTDGEELSVPVKVTLPVPEGVNLGFLDVLHYHADGTFDKIHPYIDYEKRTVTFVLTHFSDFSFAERAPASMDVTLDGATLSYDITLPEGENADFIVALYDENGAMTESRVVKITSSVSDSMTLAEANEYKAFLLLEGVPLAEAWSSAPGMILR